MHEFPLTIDASRPESLTIGPPRKAPHHDLQATAIPPASSGRGCRSLSENRSRRHAPRKYDLSMV